MNLSDKSLNAIMLILTGDNNISPNLSGPKLVDFFNSIGLAEIYYKNFPARKTYTKDKLIEINDSPKIEKIINKIVDKRRFIDTSFKIERAVNYLNEFLKIDGYEIIYIGNNFKIQSFNGRNNKLNTFHGLKDTTIKHLIEDNYRNTKPIKLNNSRYNGGDMNKKVFVVYGRNKKMRKSFFDFLRSIGLQPIEWDQAIGLTGKGSPYIGEILKEGFNNAKAIVVLFTPDEIATLKEQYIQDPKEKHPVPQPRPNAIFEAGMAMGKNPDRTVLVEIGKIREISNIIGRHIVKFDGSPKKRKELVSKLKNAGCNVNDSGSDWLDAGEFIKFKLISAVYGTDKHSINVYDKLIPTIKNDELKVTSSNDIAGDPHKGARKKLTIIYESYGEQIKVELPEKESTILP